mgnify:CR=1 FL=1
MEFFRVVVLSANIIAIRVLSDELEFSHALHAIEVAQRLIMIGDFLWTS